MRKIVISLILLACLSACGPAPHDKQELVNAMHEYDRLIKKVDADSISLLYAADGDLGDKAHGRDSIRKFLAGFNNVKIMEVVSTADSVTVNKDTALLSGHYRQSGVIDGRDTFHVKGGYHARWIWVAGEGWRIKKMTTQPEN